LGSSGARLSVTMRSTAFLSALPSSKIQIELP
jgi:hypothetical protein